MYKSTLNTERTDSHKCVFRAHWQTRWHEAHDCISVTVDLTQPLDSERHSQQHSRMCIQIFLSTSFHTHSLFSHTHTQTADWSVACFYTLLCGAKHILYQGLGSLLQKKNNFNDLTCMKKAAHIVLKANVENSCNANYTEWTFE